MRFVMLLALLGALCAIPRQPRADVVFTNDDFCDDARPGDRCIRLNGAAGRCGWIRVRQASGEITRELRCLLPRPSPPPHHSANERRHSNPSA